MTESEFHLRDMLLEDAKSGLHLSMDEGWNQTEQDWNFILGNPRNISVLAAYHHQVIGTAVAIVYADSLAWIGMVLVQKEFRGQGVSKSLLNKILPRLEFCKSLGLDATPAGQQVYKNFGFEPEYTIARMIKVPDPGLKLNPETEERLVSIQYSDLDEVINFDRQCFGADRTPLMHYLVREFGAHAWCLKKNNCIAGIILGRKGVRYHHIGPLIASTVADAKLLIQQALQITAFHPVIIDVPIDKEEWCTWLQSGGFVPQRYFTRMYTKSNFQMGKINDQYTICGPEFG